MKKMRIFALVFCIVMVFQLSCIPAKALSDDASVSYGSHSVDARVPMGETQKLLNTAKAAILYDLNSDTLIYAWNPDSTIYPSSMVKIMTALVALDRGNLTDTVTVTRSALSNLAMGYVSANLQRDEQLSLESLLYCLMTASANDAAVVIAEHIAGSQDAFVQMMNEKALEIGCTGTNFTNAHGLHDPGTITTARDICRMLRYALQNPTFKSLFTAKSYTVPATNKSEERVMSSSNNMMVSGNRFYDERVTGGKTGSTNQAGRCLAVTAEINGMNLLGIVMGAVPTYQQEGIILDYHGNFEEMKQLLDYAGERFERRQIFYEGQALRQYPVQGGANNVVTQPVSEVSTVLPLDVDETKLRWVFDDNVGLIQAPVEKGQQISNVQVWYGDVCLAQTQIVAVNAVDVWTGLASQDHSVDELSGWVVALIILGGVVAVAFIIFVFLLISRAVSVSRAKARMRNRRRNRRRIR